MTRALPAVVLTLVLAGPSVAAAQGARRVAVLPLAAGDADLEIYSVPVAREVSRHLGDALEAEVKALENAGSVPATVDLVVDGRINKVGENRIRLEARVRNAAISRTVGSVTARPRPLIEIDEAARELAARLAPVIGGWRREQPRDPYQSHPAARRSDSAGDPMVVVLRATGTAADGVIPVQEQASQAAYAFARRLGVDSIAVSDKLGDVDRVKVANVVRESRARFGLTLRIEKVRYDFRGVLSARGRARIRLIDRNGAVRFEKVVSTDTVVGARGDRHSALVYMVAEQALDIAGPQLRKALGLSTEHSSGRSKQGRPSRLQRGVRAIPPPTTGGGSWVGVTQVCRTIDRPHRSEPDTDGWPRRFAELDDFPTPTLTLPRPGGGVSREHPRCSRCECSSWQPWSGHS